MRHFYSYNFILFCCCCCILLILHFGDEVDFSAGFPARPVGSLGPPKPIRLAARPTRSSYSVFHITSFFGLDLGYLPAGFPAISWLMGLLGHPTQSSKSRFFWGFLVTDPSPVESQRFLVKIVHFDLIQKAEKRSSYDFILLFFRIAKIPFVSLSILID